MYIHIPCDFYKSNMDILFIEFTSNQNLSKEWSKNLIKSTCDTYLRVIQGEQNQNQNQKQKKTSILLVCLNYFCLGYVICSNEMR